MIEKPIFLCGFMGCGKSTVGRNLARILKCDFIDMDRYIEKKENKKIAKIFKDNGEEYFRNLETETIKCFKDKKAVIATGGGAMLREENSTCAKEIGVIILIDTKFSVCYNRIKGDKRRPLAYKSSEEELLNLYNTRREKYERASEYVIDGNVPAVAVAREIAKNINKEIF